MSERTIEVPELHRFIHATGRPINSWLDVGCINSELYVYNLLNWYFSAKPKMTGIDIFPDQGEGSLYDERIAGDIRTSLRAKTFSLVTCISVIEHTPSAFERFEIIEALIKNTEDSLYITVPYGAGYWNEEYQYGIIGNRELNSWAEALSDCKFNAFTVPYFCHDPNGIHQIWWPRRLDDMKDHAHNPKKGVDCVAIIKATRA